MTAEQDPTPPKPNPQAPLPASGEPRRPEPPMLSSSYPVQHLSMVSRIGVMGDLHGDLEHALEASRTFASRDIHVLLQLGDFSMLWPGRQSRLDKLSAALTGQKQTLYFVDGDQEWHSKLLELPVSADGVRWITDNIGHLPRGFRTVIGGRFTLAALGGANSPDRGRRTEGKNWWRSEQITESDLASLGYDHADVLVGHEAPLPDEGEILRREFERGLSPYDAAYASGSRFKFRRAVLQTHPQLTLGAHYNRFLDELITVPWEPPFLVRVVVLDRSGRKRINLAILDTATHDIEFLYRNGAPIDGPDYWFAP